MPVGLPWRVFCSPLSFPISCFVKGKPGTPGKCGVLRTHHLVPFSLLSLLEQKHMKEATSG